MLSSPSSLPLLRELSFFCVNQWQSVAKRWRPATVGIFLALTKGAALAEEAAPAEPPALQASEPLPRRQSSGARLDERLYAALSTAKAAWPGMIAGNKREVEKYNRALAQVVAGLQARRFADEDVAGEGGWFHLVVEREGADRLDPTAANLVTLAAGVFTTQVGPRTTEEGAGVPFVFCYDQGSPFLRDQPGISRFGISVPVTAFLSFDRNEARLSFYDRLERNDVDMEGRKIPLAADFSASIALALSRSPNRRSTSPAWFLPGSICAMPGFIRFSFTIAAEFP